jgi:hypothetical protein
MDATSWPAATAVDLTQAAPTLMYGGLVNGKGPGFHAVLFTMQPLKASMHATKQDGVLHGVTVTTTEACVAVRNALRWRPSPVGGSRSTPAVPRQIFLLDEGLLLRSKACAQLGSSALAGIAAGASATSGPLVVLLLTSGGGRVAHA